jgi:gliding motility-associated-like protein
VIGSCSASDHINVRAVPYPVAKAGDDILICFNTSVQLQASSDGTSYGWTPPSSLTNAETLNPVATPQGSTEYIFFAFDTKGCPKPGRDSLLVTVLPDIIAFAGRDTAVVTGQPLQFNAFGGVKYTWVPATGLSAGDIANPVGIYNFPSTGILYKLYVYNEANCLDSAFVTVKVFNTKPSVFVPTAFTPNGDGKNDKLRPIAAGMKNIEYFNIYNRWGTLVFSTHTSGDGWDGTIGGQLQATGTFVWIVKGSDYNGTPYFQKGITTLIR